MRVLRLLLIAGIVPQASIAAAAPLMPHRAVYDLELASASDRSGITGIDGRMVYEFSGSACEGYTVNFRFVTRIATSQESRLTDQRTTTFEDGQGRSFEFSTRSFIDNQLDRELKGSARLEGDKTLVELEEPQERQLELQRSQFPTQHLLELLEKAGNGETFYETTIFDASEDADKVMTTTVVLGDEAPPDASDPEYEALAPLRGDPFRPVDIAYFDLSGDPQGEELPSYRISFKLHENGVTRDLTMDYGDFSMNGTLVDLAMFEPPAPCE